MFPRRFGMVRVWQYAGGARTLLIRQLVLLAGSLETPPLTKNALFLDLVRLWRRSAAMARLGSVGGHREQPRLDPRLPRTFWLRAAARCCRVSPVEVGWLALISRFPAPTACSSSSLSAVPCVAAWLVLRRYNARPRSCGGVQTLSADAAPAVVRRFVLPCCNDTRGDSSNPNMTLSDAPKMCRIDYVVG